MNNISEQTEYRDTKKFKSTNPIMAVSFAIVLALIISAINLILFIRSDMYEKVKLIQNPVQVLPSEAILDTTSPLSVDELDMIKKGIDAQFSLLRDDNDFSIYDVSEISLGL